MILNPRPEKRELRLKIGRMRRRIDARLRAAEVEGRKLASWRTYVTRYPALAVLSAFGLGMTGATVFAPRGILKSLGAGILRGSRRSGNDFGVAGTETLVAIGRRNIMSTDRPLLADLQEELRSLGRDLREMLRLRFELFRLEAISDLKNGRRLIIIGAVAGVMILTSLPLFAVALAEGLAGVWQIARWGWLLMIAGSLLVVAILAIGLAWRRFRRRFLGLQETLEELKEDRVWLEDWLGKKGNDEG